MADDESESKSGRTREELEVALAHAQTELRRAEREVDDWEDEIAGLEDEIDDFAHAK